jgi:hypothetical protein
MKPTRVYSPVRFCIYCGSNVPPLGKEHILAYGLGGTLILPRASCKKCEAKTKGFEETVLRRMFGPYRIRFDMPTRNPEQRPEKLPFQVVKRDGSILIVTIDAKEHPGSITFPIYPEPGVLVGRGNNASFQMGMVSSIIDFPRVKALAEMHGGKGLTLGVADFNAMARLLAKTAYSYCFAEFGGRIGEFGGIRAGYRPLVLDLIAGDPDCCPTRCVGCVPGDPVEEPEQGVAHRMTVSDVKADDGTDYLVVDIRLFALLPSPVYRVAVAERPASCMARIFSKARRIAANIAKLPELLRPEKDDRP